MTMLNNIQIGSVGDPRIFALDEARELFPLVRRITADAYEELQPVKQRLRNMMSTDPRIVQVEKSYEEIVKRWVSKMERLGLVVQGLWLVDFDTGDGYLCWKYPELKINHFHDYTAGFSDRRNLEDIIEELDPDWA
jgi:hypothetical protein